MPEFKYPDDVDSQVHLKFKSYQYKLPSIKELTTRSAGLERITEGQDGNWENFECKLYVQGGFGDMVNMEWNPSDNIVFGLGTNQNDSYLTNLINAAQGGIAVATNKFLQNYLRSQKIN